MMSFYTIHFLLFESFKGLSLVLSTLHSPVHLNTLHTLRVVFFRTFAQFSGAPQPHRLAVVEYERKHEGEQHHDAAINAESLDEANVEDPVSRLEADQESGNETERGHGHENRSARVISRFVQEDG